MTITFCGAARRVTGSNHLVETKNCKFLVDCGLFQGSLDTDNQNWQDFLFDPKIIDFVVITHSHIDHIGRLPLLYKRGFRGKIYATKPTVEFCRIFLEDEYHILRNKAEDLSLDELFSITDIEETMKLFVPLDYYQTINPSKDIGLKLHDAGHILGSSIIEIGADGKKVIFSGDLGNPPVPILRDTDFISQADFVVMESTYGDRNHEPFIERRIQFERIIEDTINKKGVLLVPAFAMERTQEILYELDELVENSKIPPISIYIDSPLAIKTTEIYKRFPQYFDKEAQELIKKGKDFFQFKGLVLSRTSEESKLIDSSPDPKMIIAGSGMSTGGRILFHEKRFLPEANTTLLTIGFQVKGTLGRAIKEGAKSVKIHGEDIPIKAEIKSIESYSAHADQIRLLYWLGKIPKPIKKVFLVHGEIESMNTLKCKIQDELGINTYIPKFEEKVEI